MSDSDSFKIAIPEPVLDNLIEMIKKEPKANWHEMAEELGRVLGTIISPEVREMQKNNDVRGLAMEHNIHPADPDDPELADAPDVNDPDMKTFEFTKPAEVVAEIKRRLGLAN